MRNRACPSCGIKPFWNGILPAASQVFRSSPDSPLPDGLPRTNFLRFRFGPESGSTFSFAAFSRTRPVVTRVPGHSEGDEQLFIIRIQMLSQVNNAWIGITHGPVRNPPSDLSPHVSAYVRVSGSFPVPLDRSRVGFLQRKLTLLTTNNRKNSQVLTTSNLPFASASYRFLRLNRYLHASSYWSPGPGREWQSWHARSFP